jgi:hypothetical protein
LGGIQANREFTRDFADVWVQHQILLMSGDLADLELSVKDASPAEAPLGIHSAQLLSGAKQENISTVVAWLILRHGALVLHAKSF